MKAGPGTRSRPIPYSTPGRSRVAAEDTTPTDRAWVQVAPIWNGLLHFASEPAQTLERAVFEIAQAVTDFDAQGQGLIAVELDGQLVQVLGILRPEELSIGVRVRRGERVRIEEVDAVRNRCLVSSLTP